MSSMGDQSLKRFDDCSCGETLRVVLNVVPSEAMLLIAG